MGNLVNLNRFRKKKAKEEKSQRADTNRRLHGRTRAERATEDAENQKLENLLDGAFLIRESVRLEDIPGASEKGEELNEFDLLEAATDSAISLDELARSTGENRSSKKSKKAPALARVFSLRPDEDKKE